MACKPSNDELDEMILCCRYGDMEELVEFVQRFGDSWLESHTDENGNGALHMATANGHLGQLKFHTFLFPPLLFFNLQKT